jgi:hypothetical protein
MWFISVRFDNHGRMQAIEPQATNTRVPCARAGVLAGCSQQAALTPSPSAITLAPVVNLDHQYAQHIVLYLAHDAKVTCAVTPQAAQWPRQRLAGTAWIRRTGYAFTQKRRDAFGGLSVELG